MTEGCSGLEGGWAPPGRGAVVGGGHRRTSPRSVVMKSQGNGDFDSDVTVSLLDVTKTVQIEGKKTKKEKHFDPKDESKTTGILGLFRYGRFSDICLMLLGLFFSLVTGASLPCLGLVFGDMTNIFMDVNKRGFKNSTSNNESLFTNSSFFNASDIGDDRLTLEEFLNYMNKFTFYYLYIGLSTFTASFLQTICWEIACERQIYRLRKVFFSQVLRQDITWYDQNQQGDLNTKLSDDIERIREGIGNKFAMVTQYLTTFFSGILVGLYVDWIFTCTLFVVGPFIMAAAGFMAKMAAGTAQREQLKYSFASRVAAEVLGCIRTVAAFGGQFREVERYSKALNEGRKLAMKKYYVFSVGLFFVNFILYSGYGFGFWMACHYIAVSGYSTPGGVFTVFFTVMMGAFSLGNILPFVNSVSTAVGAARNVFKIADRIPYIDPYSKKGIIPTDMKGHILFENVSFTYATRKDVQVLSGMSMEIKPGQTVAIVGPSGAGKSTIVNMLMRFYDPTGGQVMIDRRNIRDLNLKWLRSNIGLVSQEPVLFGVSILDNIRYGRKNASLEEIITAATLANAHSFINEFPKGYDTLVGDRGAQLSGGQKQRIAIARALVKQPKILLLDEATSALDSQSEGVVQEALENAMKGRTTVIVAHRMSTIRNADLIYVMKEGKVAESGNHDALMDLRGIYYQLVTTQTQEEKKKEIYSEAEQLIESPTDGLEKHKTLANSSETSHVEDDGTSELEDKMGSAMGRLLKLNAPEWYLTFIGIIACSIAGAVQPIFALFYGSIFSTFSLEPSEMEEERLFWTCMFVLLGAVSGTAMWLWVITMASAAEFLIARIRLLAMENVLKQEISWFDFSNYSAGKIVTRLARDAPLVKHIGGLRIGQVLSALVGFIVALTIAFFFGWKLALLLLATVPIVVYGGYKQVSLTRQHLYRDLSLMDSAGKVASECIGNLRIVQALGQESEFTDLYMDYLRVPFKESEKQALFYALMFAISQGAVYFMYAAAFKFGSSLIVAGEMVPVDVYRVFFALAFSAVAIGQGSAYLQDYTKGIASSKLVFQLMDKKSKANPMDTSGLKPLVHGKVEFKNVCFTYPTRKNVQVLKNLNLEIEAGETVALVGMSGCGKSTVISLLERFYTIDGGEILVDDIDIRSINLNYLRSQIGLVTQEPVLFDCTIKENILYGVITKKTTTNHQQIIDAAKMANIHDFISCLPQGYDTLCGERGTQLSGGQKQRIAIARALIRDPKILLLDEATSALDTESEKIVQEALDKARRGRTCIVVAHRLSTIQNADKIAVIHKGAIVELGKHEELKAKNGIYHELIKRQQL